MEDVLTIDEYDALGEISKGVKSPRPSACIARNAKRLSGLKYVSYAKDGSLVLTDKGRETLMIKNCIDGLRTVSHTPDAPLMSSVASFLCKKGLIIAHAEGSGFALTQRGRETLADIDAR